MLRDIRHRIGFLALASLAGCVLVARAALGAGDAIPEDPWTRIGVVIGGVLLVIGWAYRQGWLSPSYWLASRESKAAAAATGHPQRREEDRQAIAAARAAAKEIVEAAIKAERQERNEQHSRIRAELSEIRSVLAEELGHIRSEGKVGRQAIHQRLDAAEEANAQRMVAAAREAGSILATLDAVKDRLDRLD